jgi:hypothetical protein
MAGPASTGAASSSADPRGRLRRRMVSSAAVAAVRRRGELRQRRLRQLDLGKARRRPDLAYRGRGLLGRPGFVVPCRLVRHSAAPRRGPGRLVKRAWPRGCVQGAAEPRPVSRWCSGPRRDGRRGRRADAGVRRQDGWALARGLRSARPVGRCGERDRADPRPLAQWGPPPNSFERKRKMLGQFCAKESRRCLVFASNAWKRMSKAPLAANGLGFRNFFAPYVQEIATFASSPLQ